jgi:hypothetical protein
VTSAYSPPEMVPSTVGATVSAVRIAYRRGGASFATTQARPSVASTPGTQPSGMTPISVRRAPSRSISPVSATALVWSSPQVYPAAHRCVLLAGPIRLPDAVARVRGGACCNTPRRVAPAWVAAR